MLPQNHNLPIEKLGRVFDKTTATYKFYWFISILDLFVLKSKRQMNVCGGINVMLQYIKKKVEERFHPDGYNIGINVNEAAGQSVLHCKMYLIPQYKDDVPNPKGGIRGTIPCKQK